MTGGGILTSLTVTVTFAAPIGSVDISAYVVGEEETVITGGRATVGDEVEPGTLELRLRNDDGRFTADNPLSPYYPCIVDDMPIVVRATKGASFRDVFRGTTSGWVANFPGNDAASAFIAVSGIDALGELQRKTLRHLVHERALHLPDLYFGAPQNPYALWPLDEAPGPGSSHEIFGNVPLTVRQKGKAGSGSAEYGSTVDVVPPMPGVSFARETAGDGKYLRGFVELAATHPTDNIGYGCWVQISEVTSGSVSVLSLRTPSGALAEITLESGVPTVTHTAFPGGVETVASTAGVMVPGVPYRISASVAASSGSGFNTASIRVNDGAFEFSPGTTPYWPLFLDGATIALEVGRTINTGSGLPGLPTALTVAHVWLTDEDDGFWQKHYRTAVNVSAGSRVTEVETAKVRTELLCYAAGVTPNITLDAGSLDVGPQDTDGKTALEAVLEANRHSGGYVYALPAGGINVVGTGSARSSTVALTLDAAADLDGPPTWARESIGRVAYAKAVGLSGSSLHRDADLVAELGDVGAEIETPLRDDLDRQALASFVVARGRYAKLRPKRVVVDLVTAETAGLYAAWLDNAGTAWRLGARIRIGGLSSALFGVTYIDGYLEGYTERWSVGGSILELDLSPADAPAEAVFDTQRFGWGDGICTASSLTSSGTSVTLTWTGGSTLSTSAGDYPMDLDINGERVTISSAPAGGTSPRTVTIVRGVAPTVARAHAAGEAVEVWDVARFAL